MPAFIAFVTGLLNLVITGAGVYTAGSFAYGSFHWLTGDHQRGRSWIIGSLIGVGILLCSLALGTGIAALAHA